MTDLNDTSERVAARLVEATVYILFGSVAAVFIALVVRLVALILAM